jgi:SAM-dependent methyltransferase
MISQATDSFATRCDQATCRSCRRTGLKGILDLGQMPLADGLLDNGQAISRECRYPLELAFCPDCSLVQILETVPPEIVFGADYPYYSSFSDALLAHSRQNALELIQSRKLTSASLVVEIASNDGYLLKNFVEAGIPVLGIDPAPGPAKAAQKINVPTLIDFFGSALAERLAGETGKADVIIANNVFAHVADTNGFVQGLATLLKNDGVAVMEVPYLRDLVDHCEFDTIYHEHLCYFSATSVSNLVRRHGLHLNHVKRLPIHGGSMRMFIGHQCSPTPEMLALLEEETVLGLDHFNYYHDFARRVKGIQTSLRAMLRRFKAAGSSIAAYGAAAKGAVLLNYIGAGTELIDFVVDRNVHKQGKLMPGVHIPIDEPGRILRDKPDYVLLLPWNFKDEILRQCDSYRQAGGQFIIPIPEPVVV